MRSGVPGGEGALEVEHELVQERLVRAVVEEPAEVLIIAGTAGIGGDPAFDPAGNGQSRFRFFLLDELGLGRFFFRSQGLRDCAAGREQNEKADNEPRESYDEAVQQARLSHGRTRMKHGCAEILVLPSVKIRVHPWLN